MLIENLIIPVCEVMNSKTIKKKMLFISSRKLFSFLNYKNCCNFFPYFPHLPDSKGQMKVG